jgi:hypothetical protein
MSSSVRPRHDSSLRIRVAPPEVALVDWPLVQQPLRSLLAATLTVGAGFLVAAAAGRWWAGGIAAGALAVTLWRTWLPVHYRLNGAGISQRVLGWRRDISWSAIAHYQELPGGVLLLPDLAAGPLPLAGLFLHTGSRQAEVLANLDYYLQGWMTRSGGEGRT